MQSNTTTLSTQANRNWLSVMYSFIKNIKISYLFIFLFAYTAISKLQLFSYTKDGFKLIDVSEFGTAMYKSEPLRPYVGFLVYAVPISEIIVCILLLIPKLKKWGYYGSLVLMAAFTGYVAYILLKYPHWKLPCVCGGIISFFDWKRHLIFNAAFLALAIRAVYLMRKEKRNTLA